MRKVIGIIIILFIIIVSIVGSVWFLENVSPGNFDYSYDVGNGSYMLVRSSAHVIKVVPKNNYISEPVIIPEKVVEIAWNNKYVIAKQYGMKQDSPESTYEIPDETVVNYWILDTETVERYGPYSYEDFEIKLQEFDIANLTLKPVLDFVTAE